MGTLNPLDGPCTNEGSSVATRATLLDGAYYSRMKLGLMDGPDEAIESRMRHGMGVGTSTVHGAKVCTTTWVMV